MLFWTFDGFNIWWRIWIVYFDQTELNDLVTCFSFEAMASTRIWAKLCQELQSSFQSFHKRFKSWARVLPRISEPERSFIRVLQIHERELLFQQLQSQCKSFQQLHNRCSPASNLRCCFRSVLRWQSSCNRKLLSNLCSSKNGLLRELNPGPLAP